MAKVSAMKSNRAFGHDFGFLPDPPKTRDDFIQKKLKIDSDAFVIPSIGEPGFNNWPYKPLESFCHWADDYLDEVAYRVARTCDA